MHPKFLILTILSLTLAGTAWSQGTDYWQQRAEYRMDITVDAENHQYDGHQVLTYTNNSPDTLRRVFYHLYFNAFQPGSMMDVRSRTIEDPDSRVGDRIVGLSEEEIGYQRIGSLTQDGEAVEWTVEGTVMEVTLDEPILPGQSTTFEMEWQAQVPLQIRRSGRDNAEGVEFSMSQWYPKLSEYDEDGWHPNPYVAREFYGVWGDFEVNITIDADYVMGASGQLQNPDEIGHGYQEEGVEVSHGEDEMITWRWRAEQVHDFMWGADPDFTHTTAQVPGGPLLHFLYQTDPVTENDDPEEQQQYLQNWRQLPSHTVRAFQFMSENFGQYPWETFSVIQGGDGGMEYPMGTLITGGRSLGSLVGVTVHEFIHMWYYGVLATNESRYPWIDEGFTTYASALTMGHLFGDGQDPNPHSGAYNTYFGIVESSDQEALDTHADHYHTNRAYGAASYSTGAVFLNQLRYIVGNEVFDRGMKRYFHAWKFKHPDGRDFLRVMERESGMVLDWYYQHFIESTRHIDYGITGVVGEGGETFVTLKRHELTPMPQEVLVTYADGSRELFYIPLRIMRGEKAAETDVPRTVLEDWPWTNPTYTLRIDRPASQIDSVELDPTNRVADIDRSNDTLDMSSYTMQNSDN
ncbi:MAG: M1 family metallopeptidase [Balneolaceae bacterium]|nr:M1 family metallopeptidase [Balneolaceae bacterium]